MSLKKGQQREGRLQKRARQGQRVGGEESGTETVDGARITDNG